MALHQISFLQLWIFFNHVFLEQLTGRGGPKAWPAFTADINPLDIYPWGHPKSTVNATDVSSIQGLAATNTKWIRVDSYDTWNFPASQATFCVKAQDGHFGCFL
jgi:hypothetical protein